MPLSRIPFRTARVIAVGFVLIACVGCLAVHRHGDYTVFSHSPWVGIGLLVGLAGLYFGAWWLKKSIVHFLIMATVLTVVGLVFIVGDFFTHVTVSTWEIETRGPYPFLRGNHQVIRFKDVKEIQVIPRNGVGDAADRVFVDWHFHRKSGEVETIHGSGLLSEAVNPIIEAARKNSIPVKFRAPGGWVVFQNGPPAKPNKHEAP